jgi:N-acetylmuramoyl-L-alanine amidase
MVGATMPNILVEMGFISNKSEGNFLKKNATQMKIAEAIFEGIKKYKNDIEAAI